MQLPDVVELPHFDHPSFRLNGKIFATYWTKENKAMLKLTLEDQSVFCKYDLAIFYPVNGVWGKQGATFVELKKVRKDMFKDALSCAYNAIKNGNPKKSAKK